MEWERVRCPICKSENCTKRQFEFSVLEFVCSGCGTFIIHEKILSDHLYRIMKKSDREIVSAAIKHYFEKDRSRIKIVLWPAKKPTSGVKEKTISELKKEGKTIFRGLAVGPQTV